MKQLLKKHWTDIMNLVFLLLVSVVCIVILTYMTIHYNLNLLFFSISLLVCLAEIAIFGFFMGLSFFYELYDIRFATKNVKFYVRSSNLLLSLRRIQKDLSFETASDEIEELIKKLKKFSYYEEDYLCMTKCMVNILHNLKKRGYEESFHSMKNDFKHFAKLIPFFDLREKFIQEI